MPCLAHRSSTHQHICVFKVISPVRPDLPLASNVPNVEFKALRLDAFNVETLESTQNITSFSEQKQLYILIIIIIKQEIPLYSSCGTL